MTKTKNKTRIIGLLLSLIMVIGLFSALGFTASAEAAEDLSVTIDTDTQITLKDNNENGAYDIDTADALYAFAAAVNNGNTTINGELTQNIIINNNVLEEEGKLNPYAEDLRVWTPIAVTRQSPYNGTFNGNNKTISGLYFNDSTQEHIGLFGYIGGDGVVQNLGITDSYLFAYSYVGGIANRNNGTITNCYNEGSIGGEDTLFGGIVSENTGTITNCYNSGYITGFAYTAGIAASNDNTITNCYNTNDISGTDHVAGITSLCSGGIISKCYNTGNILAIHNELVFLAGIVADLSSNGIVENCYNTGLVGGSKLIGGIVANIGEMDSGKVINCHNTGVVYGTQYSGGIIGYTGMGGAIQNCYFLKTDSINENKYGIGCYGLENPSNDGAEPKNDEFFASGELAVLLGSEWGQKIGTEAYPVLDGEAIYYGYLSCSSKAISSSQRLSFPAARLMADRFSLASL